ncbi:MAG: hypothetical protein ABEL76_15685 [Bradymonadaceae bacterium]
MNRTVIRTDGESLETTAGPFPIPWSPREETGSETIRASDVYQIYCEKRRTGRRGSITYGVTAVLEGGRGVELVEIRGDDLQSAVYIESRLEDYLDVTDRPYPGEVDS